MGKFTHRSRFIRHALFEPVDRPPYIDALGFWPQTVKRWHGEGLPKNVRHKYENNDFKPGDITIEEYFSQEIYDWAPMMPSPVETPLCPAFEKKILENNEDTIVFRDTSGIVRKEMKRGRSIPQFLKFPVESWDDWNKLKSRLDPSDQRRYESARIAAAKGFNGRENLIPFSVCGAYGLSRNLFGEEKVAYAYYDIPELMHDIMRCWLKFYIENAKQFTERIDFDFVYFWEDMACKSGPLIGPNLAKEFITPYYRELIQEMRGMGLKVFALDSDGNNKVLMDDFVEAGINHFFPCEIAADMEPEWISERYGTKCSMQGGIDKRTLLESKDDIKSEVMRKVPKLLERGGYIPGLDHTVACDIPFENFCYLVELLRKLTHQIQPCN